MDVDLPSATFENFSLQELLENCGQTQKLKKMQTIANMLVFQAESYKSLKKMIPVMEMLHVLQPYRVIDKEGKQFLSGFRMTTDEVVERYTRTFSGHREINVLNVNVSEAHALALQNGHFLKDWKLKKVGQAHELDTYLQHPNENIRAVAGMTKNYVYSYQLAHLIFEAPQAITGFNTVFIGDQIGDKLLIPACSLEKDAYLAVMQLPTMRKITVSLARLVEHYRASGSDDDMFEIYIGPECLSEVEHAKTLCAEFEQHSSKFQKLYDQVRCEMSRIILQCPKVDKWHLRDLYCSRISSLFNTNASCKLEDDALALTRHYVVDRELPQILDCRVTPALVFAKPVSSDYKKSFLPIAYSAPVARHQPQGKKKKNKSQPTTRPQSPSQATSQSSSEQSTENLPVLLREMPKLVALPVIVTSSRSKLPSPKYDGRVDRWFNPNTKDPEVVYATHESIEYHGYTRLVDPYLLKFGEQTPWENRSKGQRAKDVVIDTNYSLGGSIECSGVAKRFVVFHLCLDRMGVCYHRGIDVKEKNELFDEYFQDNRWKVFHRDEFPPLGQEEPTFEAVVSANRKDEVVSEDDLCVKIRDNHLDKDIVLFKPSKK